MMRAPVFGKVVLTRFLALVHGKLHGSCTHFEQAYSNAEGDTGAAQRTLVVRDGPGVAGKRLENACELELALLDWHEEAGGTEGLWGEGLSRTRRGAVLGRETEHVLDLLLRILLVPAEDV